MSIIKFIAQPVEVLSGSKIISTPVEELSLSEQTQSHVLLAAVESVVKERKEALRKVLLDAAKAADDPDPKGHYKITVDGNVVSNEKRTAATADEEALRALLQAKGIEEKAAFTSQTQTITTTTTLPDPSKLEGLVKTGKLTRKEVDALYPETRALRITPSKDLKLLAETIKAAGAASLAEAAPVPALPAPQATPAAKPKTKKAKG